MQHSGVSRRTPSSESQLLLYRRFIVQLMGNDWLSLMHARDFQIPHPYPDWLRFGAIGDFPRVWVPGIMTQVLQESES